MITITLQRDESGWLRRFTATGHAGYGEHGSDIICAAVTALAATAIGSMQELAGLDPARQLQDGLIAFDLPEQADLSGEQQRITAILLQSLMIGCRQIQQSYGSRYIRFRQKRYKGGHAK
ncbi:MAG: ribosomal-processing cysteine protease Prp [Ruminococcaceae bacterium]|jgi:uncharacterized protein YsxB (DUF464 family)|nr:ribosomal-processing cysteine protease Prp [Oscillospiraceae bacterium]